MPEPSTLRTATDEFLEQEASIRMGGGAKAIDRQHAKDRLTARERIEKLVDPGSVFQELGLWAAFGMYKEHGGAPAAGVVTGVGTVSGRRHMIIANDATVKAGRVLPDDVQEDHPCAAHRAQGAAAADLSGGLGGRVPASAGGRLPGHGRLRTDLLSQQR